MHMECPRAGKKHTVDTRSELRKAEKLKGQGMAIQPYGLM